VLIEAGDVGLREDGGELAGKVARVFRTRAEGDDGSGIPENRTSQLFGTLCEVLIGE
jgi:hypothetical protein